MSFSKEQMKAVLASPLFKGLEERQVKAYLDAVGAFPQRTSPGKRIVEQGESREDIFLILEGRARGERLTSDGRGVTVNEFGPGELFGDLLSGAERESPVSVVMTEEGSLLRLPLSTLFRRNGMDEYAGERVLRNLIAQISDKYFKLMKRLEMVMCPTLRGKIAIYLIEMSKNDKITFVVPHSREEQAALLDCDRSALSRELGRMKAEGIIDFSGRSFRILKPEELNNSIQ